MDAQGLVDAARRKNAANRALEAVDAERETLEQRHRDECKEWQDRFRAAQEAWHRARVALDDSLAEVGL